MSYDQAPLMVYWEMTRAGLRYGDGWSTGSHANAANAASEAMQETADDV